MSYQGHSEIFMTSMIASSSENAWSKMSWLLRVSMAHTGDVYRSYSSNGERFWYESLESFWTAWFDISIVDSGVLLLVSSCVYEFIYFPLLVWTWISATIVPSHEVEPIVVLDSVKKVSGK